MINMDSNSDRRGFLNRKVYLIVELWAIVLGVIT